MEIPNELRGYAGSGLRVRIGDLTYVGVKSLECIPEELSDQIMKLASAQLKTGDSLERRIDYPIGVSIWYHPVSRPKKVWHDSRSLDNPRRGYYEHRGHEIVWP